jgi:hypothetical protein
MTQNPGAYGPGGGGAAAQRPARDVARDEAANVGNSAREAGSHVAQSATDQARQVVSETRAQAYDLLGEAKGQVRHQAATQQHQAAQQLWAVADELSEMAAKGGRSGLATQMAQEAAERVRGAASWLDRREPGDLLDGVRDFARRHPGQFLVGAAVAGVVAGRLTRGLTGAAGPNGQPRPYASGEPRPYTAPEPPPYMPSEPQPYPPGEPQPRTAPELRLGDDAPTMADPVPPLPGERVPGSAAGGAAGRRPAGSDYRSGSSATYRPGQP